jgi:hypothetical protein
MQQEEEGNLQDLHVCHIGLLLAPNTGLCVDLRFFDLVENVDEIKNFNLSDFVVKLLVKGIKNINDGTSSGLIGSPFLLIVSNLVMSK